MQKRLTILNLISDYSGCYQFRCRIPLDSLAQYGVVWLPYSFLPAEVNNPDSFSLLVSMVKSVDLVIISRCYLKSVVEKVRMACSITNTALIKETDDDYLSIIPSNPCYWAIVRDQNLFSDFNQLQHDANDAYMKGDKGLGDKLVATAQSMLPALMESRKQGEDDLKWILQNVDGVTTSTPELAATIYLYNKNVQVFENHVQFCYPWRLDAPESAFIKDVNGKKQVSIYNRLGLYTIPKFAIMEHTIKGNIKANEIKKTPRVGYTSTPSHWGEDFETIREGLNNVAKTCWNKAWYVFFDKDQGQRFANCITNDRGRALSLPSAEYMMYTNNLNNIDIGLAPLAPTTFNLCKSDIKFVEYASWGSASLLPYYQTYLRSAKEGETALFYRNQKEFEEKLELLITKPKLREEIGKNALDYVINNRLSWLEKNSYPRYKFYLDMVKQFPKTRIYKSATI